MQSIGSMIRTIIDVGKTEENRLTLLAVCPNSVAVLEAAVLAASRNRTPMLFAATLNQVDRDKGYTGWTQQAFVKAMHEFAAKHDWDTALYPCLDHGGPWLKDVHTIQGLTLEETMVEVKESLTASLEAGYRLLHIDPTVDRTLPPGEPLAIETVVERTVDLIQHAESVRQRLGLPAVDYEVGTEEVHGGLVDFASFERFIVLLHESLEDAGLLDAWPCLIVAKVGTDLHTTYFDPEAARRLHDLVAPFGSLIKGHYTDWVENPRDYPRSGMGGANVGPEFTTEEYLALTDLVEKEETLCRYRPSLEASRFLQVLEDAVVESGRWKKWLQPDEEGQTFATLSADRRAWLTQTGARYVWAEESVRTARQRLYDNLRPILSDPNQYVVERIAAAIDRYITAFNLFDSLTLFDEGPSGR